MRARAVQTDDKKPVDDDGTLLFAKIKLGKRPRGQLRARENRNNVASRCRSSRRINEFSPACVAVRTRGGRCCVIRPHGPLILRCRAAPHRCSGRDDDKDDGDDDI